MMFKPLDFGGAAVIVTADKVCAYRVVGKGKRKFVRQLSYRLNKLFVEFVLPVIVKNAVG